MGKLILDGITVENLVKELSESLQSQVANPDQLRVILCEAVPDLTKSQVAKMLGGSKGFVDELVKTGHLQETPGTVEKFKMSQVLKCLFQGKTGRNKSFNLENLMK